MTTCADARVHLLVDDELDTLLHIYKEVFPPPWEVVQVYNGWQALEFLEKGPPVRAALVDQKLPDCAGTDLVPAIRERYPWARIAVYSAYWLLDILAAARELRVEYIVKMDTRQDLEGFKLRMEGEALAIFEHARRRVSAYARLTDLTPKQADLALTVLFGGEPLKVIADKLDRSLETLRTHLAEVRRKTGHKDLDTLRAFLREEVFHPGVTELIDRLRAEDQSRDLIHAARLDDYGLPRGRASTEAGTPPPRPARARSQDASVGEPHA